MTYENELRARRRRLHMTQAQLAAAAGVSRQLVVAAETGVNTPSVGAALRLAAVLGCETEDLFGVPARPVDGPPSAPSVRTAPGGFVVEGCDPMLRIAESMLAGAGPAALVALDASTSAALRSLRRGGVHAAVVHGPPGRLPDAPPGVVRIQLARWRVGIGIAASAHVTSLEECLERGVPLVQRERGASSQRALERMADALGGTPAPSAIVSGHLDGARAASAMGCAAITTEGAATMFALRFEPLELHTVELWVDARAQRHPGLLALGDLLSGRDFRVRARRLGGYDLTGSGTVLA